MTEVTHDRYIEMYIWQAHRTQFMQEVLNTISIVRAAKTSEDSPDTWEIKDSNSNIVLQDIDTQQSSQHLLTSTLISHALGSKTLY